MSPVPKKIERGDSLVSPGMVCYAEKQVKPFWFSSLDQIVQFDTIIFCRTFKNYFGQFVWIEKKKKRKVTIIVAFHFMKRRLKNLTIRLYKTFSKTLLRELRRLIGRELHGRLLSPFLNKGNTLAIFRHPGKNCFSMQ